MMENLKDLQLKHLMVPMVRAVLALVVPTMAAVAVDVTVAPGAPVLPAPMLATTVAIPAPAAPAASAGRKCLKKNLELWIGSHLVHIIVKF